LGIPFLFTTVNEISAQAFQLPMIPPNLPEQDSGLFPNGANFAVAGATAMPPAYYRRWNHSVPMPHSLGVQIGWFKEMLQRLAPGDDDGNTYIPHSPITSAHSWFLLGRSMMLIA